ncbi:MAG: hypothetical protein OXH96_15600 [Spirochaetaceae bacterium]|nr:hypothetical protein [Spirochaetaceae bacterium]
MRRIHPAALFAMFAMALLASGCADDKVIPETALSAISAISDPAAIGDRIEIKEVRDRGDYAYIMIFIGSPQGEFTTLDDGLARAQTATLALAHAIVEIINKHDVNKDVRVWAQLPLRDGGVTVLGHAAYEARNNSFHEFERFTSSAGS